MSNSVFILLVICGHLAYGAFFFVAFLAYKFFAHGDNTPTTSYRLTLYIYVSLVILPIAFVSLFPVEAIGRTFYYIVESPAYRIFLAIASIGTFALIAKLAIQLRNSQRISGSSENSIETFDSAYPILKNSQISSPIAIGLLSPKIIVPTGFLDSLTEKQKAVLVAHEEAHLQRGDLWVLLFQRLFACLFWWNPLIWFIERESAMYREMICDDVAVSATGDAISYANSILDIAAQVGSRKQKGSFSMQFACIGSMLDRRIIRLKSQEAVHILNRQPGRQGPDLLVFVLVAAAVVLLPVSRGHDYLENFVMSMPDSYRPSGVPEYLRINQFELSRAIRNRSVTQAEQALLNGASLKLPVERDLLAIDLNISEGNEEITRLLISWENQNLSTRGLN